jgi:Tol biopolymer transport system component
VWFDRSGKEVGFLGPPGDWEDPRISPDGTRVAANRLDASTGMSNIWLLGPSSETARRFTFAPTFEHSPIWSPDGGRIAFDSYRAKPVHIYQKSLRGDREDNLVRGENFKTPTDWSRDGRFLIYQSLDPQTHWDLWYVDLSGARTPVAFLRSSFNELGGQISPDGRWLAYTSDESGSWEVYVAAFPGPGGKWQVSSGGGTQAVWSRDGNEIFYLGADRTMMAVAVRGGNDFIPLPPQRLFQTRARYTGNRAFDVTADARRFLVSTVTVEEKPVPITVVLNVVSELTQ